MFWSDKEIKGKQTKYCCNMSSLAVYETDLWDRASLQLSFGFQLEQSQLSPHDNCISGWYNHKVGSSLLSWWRWQSGECYIVFAQESASFHIVRGPSNDWPAFRYCLYWVWYKFPTIGQRSHFQLRYIATLPLLEKGHAEISHLPYTQGWNVIKA